MGTRFVASEEAPISPAYKDVVLKANERSTVEVADGSNTLCAYGGTS